MIVGALTWIWMISEQLQLVLGRFWLIVGGFEWCWLVWGDCRCFWVDDFGWLWIVVGAGRWFWVVLGDIQ